VFGVSHVSTWGIAVLKVEVWVDVWEEVVSDVEV